MVNARLGVGGGAECQSKLAPLLLGSSFNVQRLVELAGARSGRELVEMLAKPKRVRLPVPWKEEAPRLQHWSRNFLRVASGTADGAGFEAHRAMNETMPLEVHAFLHHAVGWPLAARLSDQPTRRLRDPTVDVRAVVGNALAQLRRQMGL